MGTDLARILGALTSFHDFTDRTVVHVGAGGGRLIGYAASARHVLAVDLDGAAADQLLAAVRMLGLEDRCEVRSGDFLDVAACHDAVLFEFSLHEFPDPSAALRHARALAPDIVIIDHLPDSEWAWHVGEERLLERSWNAVRRFPVRAETRCEAQQAFSDFEELKARLSSCGEIVQRRIARFAGDGPITMAMPYRLALL